MSKNFKTITIETLPNGYAMTVDVDRYMYFSVGTLIEGFFTHVGLGMAKFLDKDTMHALMTACATWPKEGDAIQEAARLSTQVESLQRTHQTDTTRIANLKTQVAELNAKLEDVKLKLARYTAIEENRHPGRPATEKPFTKESEAAAAKATSHITQADLVQKQPKITKKTAVAPLESIPYSDAVYNALMLPLTIDKTGLPTRVLSIMKMVGGSSNATVGDALMHPKKEFEKIRGFGKGVAEKLDAFIRSHHLTYAMNVEEILMKHAMQNNPNIK